MIVIKDSTRELLENLSLDDKNISKALETIETGESRYTKDLRINLANALISEHLNEKETALIGLSIAVNDKNDILSGFFEAHALAKGATHEETAEAAACASLLAANNVFYRFRHFSEKEVYEKLPARIKMNIMMKPVLGKELFELISLAVSAVNGCEMCVKSHEKSVIDLGTSEERVFDAIRLAAVVVSLGKVVY